LEPACGGVVPSVGKDFASVPPATEGMKRLGACPICGVNLPLQLPSGDEVGLDWSCVKCGMQIYAMLCPDCTDEDRARVRPVSMEIDLNPFLQPPPGRAEVITRLLARKDPNGNSSPARLGRIPAMPMDSQYRPTGESFIGLLMQLSQSEVLLAHSRDASAPYLAIELQGKASSVQTVVRVLESRSVGLFYEISGEFVTKIGG